MLIGPLASALDGLFNTRELLFQGLLLCIYCIVGAALVLVGILAVERYRAGKPILPRIHLQTLLFLTVTSGAVLGINLMTRKEVRQFLNGYKPDLEINCTKGWPCDAMNWKELANGERIHPAVVDVDFITINCFVGLVALVLTGVASESLIRNEPKRHRKDTGKL
jgi:hypothetical protein